VITLKDESLHLVMAIYAMHLGTGHSLSSRVIKAGTIRRYLKDAADFSQHFDDQPMRDIRKPRGETHLAKIIDNVLKELQRWENVPNRREPYTPAMQLELLRRSLHDDILSLRAALADWFGVNLTAGCRLTEWAQEDGHAHLYDPILNARGDPYAFCYDDVEFLGAGRRRLSTRLALARPYLIHAVRLTFRMQKNGQHGEKKTFTRNTTHPDLDTVERWVRILKRFVSLCGHTSGVPLCVYKSDNSKTVNYITASDIEAEMRSLAAVVYGFDPSKPADHAELLKFSAHSLRVGACCILQAMGFPDHAIQQLLRWLSDSWKVYTRNLITIAQQQAQAVVDVAELPNF
jgi:hypothetical protein